jgi:L-lysine exporter family protein LysE/ArgO
LIAFLPGLLTGLSLIVAIGAQNAFVIRQGLTRSHVFLVVAICALADLTLIWIGVAGLGALIISLPWLLEVIRWFGVAYLSWFGFRSARAAFKNESLDAAGAAEQSATKVAATALALTFLNPHVYLDTVILLGSIGNQFGPDKWFFATGASVASILWFTTVGYGAKAASRLMSKPVFWRILDSVIAVIMFGIALTLAFYRFS